MKTDSRVVRVVIEKGRAVGVEYLEGGQRKLVRAEREVIVSVGAIGSPHLLMLSGIGPASHLASVGVPVVHDLPGVGENLQDHMDMFLIYDLTGPHSYDKYKKLLSGARGARICAVQERPGGIEYLRRRTALVRRRCRICSITSCRARVSKKARIGRRAATA